MGIWFSRNIGDAMLADESLAHIKEVFLSKYKDVVITNEMAVFFRHESVGRVHCEVIVYFSPATSIVAQGLDTLPCKKPALDGLGLLVGREESWSVLFG